MRIFDLIVDEIFRDYFNHYDRSLYSRLSLMKSEKYDKIMDWIDKNNCQNLCYYASYNPCSKERSSKFSTLEKIEFLNIVGISKYMKDYYIDEIPTMRHLGSAERTCISNKLIKDLIKDFDYTKQYTNLNLKQWKAYYTLHRLGTMSKEEIRACLKNITKKCPPKSKIEEPTFF